MVSQSWCDQSPVILTLLSPVETSTGLGVEAGQAVADPLELDR